MGNLLLTKRPGFYVEAINGPKIDQLCAEALKTIPPSADMDFKPLPSLKKLKRIFDVRSAFDGKLIRNVSCGGLQAGQECGTKNTEYVRVFVNQEQFSAHRIIFKIVHEREPKGIVHHRDGNGRNNHPSNLEEVTVLENNRRRVRCNSSSGVIGVSWNERYKRWCADISAASRNIKLGAYLNKECAIKARQRGELALFGYRLVDVRCAA